MWFYVVLAVLAASATSVEPACNCDKVDCSTYKFAVTPNDNGFGECRFKMRNDNPDLANKFGSGLQVHGYADLTKADSGEQKDSQDCPAGGKLRMTESPRFADGMALYPGGFDYVNCCVPKVLNYCYYKVVAYFNCHLWSPMPSDPKNNDREDDVLKTVEVLYRNLGANKRVTVTFFPKLAKVTCTNDFGGPPQEILYKGLGVPVVKSCGDSDINVKIQRYENTDSEGNTFTMLKTHRYQCGSQYVAMFTDPSAREKITMRTVLTRPDAVGGATIGPVLAQSYSGKCGKIAKTVTQI